MAKTSSNPARGGWGQLSPVAWPSVRYRSLPPQIIRNYTSWRHDSGSFLYKNAGYVWEQDPVDLQGLFMHGVDGNDHTLYEFFAIVTLELFNSIIYDPQKIGAHFAVYASEWQNIGKATTATSRTGRYRLKPKRRRKE